MSISRDAMCPILRDFLTYHEAIQGHSRKTVDEYYLDLRRFFRAGWFPPACPLMKFQSMMLT